jgi:hypothetical protein
MIVIADTGPVNYLILIGEIEILPVAGDSQAAHIAGRGFGSPRCRRT